ncbi:Endonuclease/exonuclease/phosphatase, partial [Earliella scabrosa]
MMINQLLRDKRVAVLALQETHLTEERLECLNNLFAQSMTVYSSPDPTNESGARGVAFAVNKRLVDTENATVVVVVPGRAIRIRVPWGKDAHLDIMNVYAPNDEQENSRFWATLLEKTPGNLDVLAGDFNVVEDAEDRLPSRCDNAEAVHELGKLKAAKRLVDGWREENPGTKKFTYLQMATGSQSRIDRIYIKRKLVAKAVKWVIEDSGVPTDHRLVLCEICKFRTPFVGKGRWAIPPRLQKDKELLQAAKKMGLKRLGELEGLDEDDRRRNIQQAYAQLKQDIVDEARRRAKTDEPKIAQRISRLKREL